MHAEELRNLVNGFRISRIILTAFELDLFTIIGKKGNTAANISREACTDKRATAMLLDALCALGIVSKQGQVYYNSAMASEWLDRSSQDYISGFQHINFLWKPWSTLTEAVKTGSCVIRREERSKDSGWLAAFIEGMHDRARHTAASLIAGLELVGVRKALDLGGGPGTFAMEIVKQHPRSTAVVFDLPQVVPLTRQYIRKAGLDDRMSTLAGDFTTDDLGSDYDLIFVSAIIHSLSEEENQALLMKCSRALNPKGYLVIQDYIMNEDRTFPPDGALFAINMLVNTPAGTTYTESEVRTWMQQAGLDHIRRIDTPFRTTQLLGIRPVIS
jgi:SAM-dependent methyltransferase